MKYIALSALLAFGCSTLATSVRRTKSMSRGGRRIKQSHKKRRYDIPNMTDDQLRSLFMRTMNTKNKEERHYTRLETMLEQMPKLANLNVSYPVGMKKKVHHGLYRMRTSANTPVDYATEVEDDRLRRLLEKHGGKKKKGTWIPGRRRFSQFPVMVN